MKKIFFAFFLLITAACSSPKMTKLETELDKIISKYDTAFWKEIKNISDYPYAADTIFIKKQRSCFNDTLTNELKNFYPQFFLNETNINDLIFARVENDFVCDEDNYYYIELNSEKYFFISRVIEFTNLNSTNLFNRFKIKKAKIKIKNKSIEPLRVYKSFGFDKIEILLPLLEIELTDAEFEKL